MSTPSHSVGLGIHTRGAHADPAKLATNHREQHSLAAPTADNEARQPRRTLTGPRAPRPQGRAPPDPGFAQDHGLPEPTAVSVAQGSSAFQRVQSHRHATTIDDGDLRGLVQQEGHSRYPISGPTTEARHGSSPKHQRRASTSDYRAVGDRSQGSTLPRDVTLLSFGGSHARSAAELKSLLGNSNARLKAGSAILPDHVHSSADRKAQKEHAVALEQAKSRARVEVDIVLESNVCVQGGYLRGHVKVRIRKRSKKEGSILLSEGKIRVVGYESVPSEDENHTFYQCAAPLSAVTDASRSLYEAAADDEGFAPATEGMHVLPFALKLPADNFFGSPKGVVSFNSGISVRYIAMVSVKVKEAESGKRSIAHFYRHCEIWPYLNPATVLQPASRPLQASTAKSMALIGNSSKVKLHAQIHRLYWPAGSRCPVSLNVVNGSKKTIRSLTLTLVRTNTVFRPRPMLDAGGDRDPDSCQTSTTHKVVSESVLEICAGVVKGHASAKGWWTGIAPGRELDFLHYISLPAEALSVTRARLLEVEYSIRVTISAGSLSPDVSVTLPIRIFNFLSLDPPPSAGLLSSSGAYIRPSNSLLSHSTEGPPMSMTEIAALASDNKLFSVTPEEACPDDLPLPPYPSSRTCSLRVTNPDASSVHLPAPPSQDGMQPAVSETSVYSTDSSTTGSDLDEPLDGPPSYIGNDGSSRKRLGNLDLHEDADSDEEVRAVLGSAQVDSGRFASSLRTSAHMTPRGGAPDVLRGSRSQPGMHVSTLGADGNTPRMEGVGAGTSFASRVQQKRRALAAARLQQRTRGDSLATAGMPVKKSASAFLPESSTEEEDEETTPRLGYRAARTSHGAYADDAYESSYGYSSAEPASDCDEGPHHAADDEQQTASRLARAGSRTLPVPPAPVSSYPSRINEASAAGSSAPPCSSGAVPASNSRVLPTPPRAPATAPAPAAVPPVPPIPPHILALCSRQKGDADPLRKSIIRPPRSPLRALTRDSGTSSSSDGGSGVAVRIAALEHRVRSSQDGDYAYC